MSAAREEGRHLPGVRLGCEFEVVGADARVFRVVICPACRWQYGSWWLTSTPVEYWGDCPRCGGKTTLESHFLPEHRGVAGVPAQQELKL